MTAAGDLFFQIRGHGKGRKKCRQLLAGGLKPAELRSADSRGRLSPHEQFPNELLLVQEDAFLFGVYGAVEELVVFESAPRWD
jgi:hypothetical protein